MTTPPMAAKPNAEVTVWAQTMERVAAVGDRLTTAMRERGEEVDGDVYLTMLGVLMNSYLNHVSAEPDHPTFVPCTGWFQRLGFPNPDTVYRAAPVTGTAAYRLIGERGTAWQVTIMPFSTKMVSSTPWDLSDVARQPDGRFDVLVSGERPDGYTGNWWKLEPDTGSLWIRSVSDRWAEVREPRIAIERVNGGSRRRRSNDDVAQRLVALAAAVERSIEFGIRHADGLNAEGIVNRLKAIDYGANGGMPLQWYHEGLYELDDDQALLIEAHLPDGCDYFSWSLLDRVWVTLDWTHAQTSLNRTQASIDEDRVLRVVVANSDPGAPNWMDTTGYRRGALNCRFIGSVEAPTVESGVVPLDSVFDHLPPGTPPVTPEQRAASLHERRMGFQLRCQW